jgi:hypothetical protein
VFRTPFEIKLVMYKYFIPTPVSITLNSGISFYFNNHSLPKLHLSPGISVYTASIFAQNADVFMSLYPLYEFPLNVLKQEPLMWTIAWDGGYNFAIGSTPLFFGMYLRLIYTILGDTGEKVESFLDGGLTFGFHFK